MTWLELTTLDLLAIWNLCTYGFVWMAVTPTARLSFAHAMVMTQSATAVTNTVPAVGPAIGIGMTYQMLGRGVTRGPRPARRCWSLERGTASSS